MMMMMMMMMMMTSELSYNRRLQGCCIHIIYIMDNFLLCSNLTRSSFFHQSVSAVTAMQADDPDIGSGTEEDSSAEKDINSDQEWNEAGDRKRQKTGQTFVI